MSAIVVLLTPSPQYSAVQYTTIGLTTAIVYVLHTLLHTLHPPPSEADMRPYYSTHLNDLPIVSLNL